MGFSIYIVMKTDQNPNTYAAEIKNIRKTAVLTAKQKKFCREYVKLGDDQIEAVMKVYDYKDRGNGSQLAREMMLDPRIATYIEFVRHEIEIGIPDTMAWMVKKGVEAVEVSLRKEQGASAAKALEVLDKMRGTGRRHHSFNPAHYDTMREKLDVIYQAFSAGEIGTDQFVAMTQSVKSVETEQLVAEVEAMKARHKENEKEENEK